MNEELVDYIKKAKENGWPPEEIKKNLLEAGWTESEIREHMRHPHKLLVPLVLAVAVLVVSTAVYFVFFSKGSPLPPYLPPPAKDQVAVLSFKSEEEFKEYIAKSEVAGFGGYIGREFSSAPSPASFLREADGFGGGGGDRFSETNVQVRGIDEPDIVKTDGKSIYASSEDYFYPFYGSVPSGSVRVVKSFPASDLAISAKIDKAGNLLLSDNTLVVFSNREITGYDVANPASPSQKWNIKLEEKTNFLDARLHEKQIYLATQTFINKNSPCPIRPLVVKESPVEIKCDEIQHPIVVVPEAIVFEVFRINLADGAVEKKISFVGSHNSSVVYMSPEAIYITFVKSDDGFIIFSDFLKSSASDLLPTTFFEKIKKLEGYDISTASKMSELGILIQQYIDTLSSEEQDKFEEELEKRAKQYVNDHKRDLVKTGIVKISNQNLEIKTTGEVPGTVLNQFSLDEHKGNLRIATTTGNASSFFGGQGETANDVYILDNNLAVIGQVLDLGLTERIYSARFLGDLAYLVTFRQVDPFYVLDLKDPKNPKAAGELKIPGFSSYLHPLKENHILGVGQEDFKTKISMFNVENPASPVEIFKLHLDDAWTEISYNHHAYLQDEKYQVFFLPAGNKAHVVSYQNDKLGIVQTVESIRARRAVYINDFLYIIGDDKIVVLDEPTWQQVKELKL